MAVFINKNDENKKEYSCAQVTDMEGERKRRGLTVDQFYAVPRQPYSSSALPIFDEAHVKNAMARFNQARMSQTEKRVAYNKIIRAAGRHGINLGKFKASYELAKNNQLEGIKIYDEDRVEVFEVNE